MERDRVKVHERHRMRMKALCLAIALGISLFIYPLLSRAAVNDRAVQENFPAVLSPERVPADPDDEISTRFAELAVFSKIKRVIASPFGSASPKTSTK